MKLWLLDVYLLQITHKELIYQNKQDIITQHTVDKVVENLVWRAVPLLLSRTIIETPLNLLNLLRRQAHKRAVLGQVLADQLIGVLDVWLVRRAVGARKVNWHP